MTQTRKLQGQTNDPRETNNPQRTNDPGKINNQDNHGETNNPDQLMTETD